MNVCALDGCPKEARGPAPGTLCGMHYFRRYRTGRLDLIPRPRKESYRQSHGYIRVNAPNHPMADSKGYAYEHRKVYYDKHGAGPFFCHWCRKPIRWESMHVDHVNGDRADNLLENLVSACPPCNIGRGYSGICRTQRRRGIRLTLGNETMCLAEWARRLGMSAQALKSRIDSDWPLERALTEPPGNCGPQKYRRRNLAERETRHLAC